MLVVLRVIQKITLRMCTTVPPDYCYCISETDNGQLLVGRIGGFYVYNTGCSLYKFVEKTQILLVFNNTMTVFIHYVCMRDK